MAKGIIYLMSTVVDGLIKIGKTDNFETRLAQAHEKFKDNSLVMEQVEFIDDSLQGRRKVMTSD